jgi:hypothetical protein
MTHSSNSAVSPSTHFGVGNVREGDGEVDVLLINLARSMIGRSVALQVGARGIAHGVVNGVFTEEGMPKIVVGGMIYDPHQVLTLTPTSLN